MLAPFDCGAASTIPAANVSDAAFNKSRRELSTAHLQSLLITRIRTAELITKTTSNPTA